MPRLRRAVRIPKHLTRLRRLLPACALALTAGCSTHQKVIGGVTGIAGLSPAQEVEQVYYLGVFDPHEQIPSTLYRVTVRGQASLMSKTRFASGWLPAKAVDSLTSTLKLDVNTGGVSVENSALHAAVENHFKAESEAAAARENTKTLVTAETAAKAALEAAKKKVVAATLSESEVPIVDDEVREIVGTTIGPVIAGKRSEHDEAVEALILALVVSEVGTEAGMESAATVVASLDAAAKKVTTKLANETVIKKVLDDHASATRTALLNALIGLDVAPLAATVQANVNTRAKIVSGLASSAEYPFFGDPQTRAFAVPVPSTGVGKGLAESVRASWQGGSTRTLADLQARIRNAFLAAIEARFQAKSAPVATPAPITAALAAWNTPGAAASPDVQALQETLTASVRKHTQGALEALKPTMILAAVTKGLDAVGATEADKKKLEAAVPGLEKNLKAATAALGPARRDQVAKEATAAAMKEHADGLRGTDDPGFATGRRLMMFGPEGFREAPANHRLVIMMSSSPEEYFEAVGDSVAAINRASARKVDASVSNALMQEMSRVSAEEARIELVARDGARDIKGGSQ